MLLDDENRKKFVAMIEAGLPATVAAATVDAFFQDQLSLDDRRFLLGPVIVHGNGWQHDIPGWMIDQAIAERVEIVLGAMPGHVVGPTEIGAVMYPAVMAAPLQHDAHELYLWATVNAIVRKGKATSLDAAWKMLNQTPIADKDVLDPNGRLHWTYGRLCDDIRRKVIAAGKDRVRAKPSKAESTPKSETPAPGGDLFDMYDL